jgi:hypothetical protein
MSSVCRLRLVTYIGDEGIVFTISTDFICAMIVVSMIVDVVVSTYARASLSFLSVRPPYCIGVLE